MVVFRPSLADSSIDFYWGHKLWYPTSAKEIKAAVSFFFVWGEGSKRGASAICFQRTKDFELKCKYAVKLLISCSISIDITFFQMKIQDITSIKNT